MNTEPYVQSNLSIVGFSTSTMQHDLHDVNIGKIQFELKWFRE